jgi:hypothetical protein
MHGLLTSARKQRSSVASGTRGRRASEQARVGNRPYESGGFTQAEAEALEVVVRGCDYAVEQARAIGDDELVRLVVERGQAMIDSTVAQVFIDR